MALNADAVLESFIKKIIYNKKIMEILNLPVINVDDSEELIKEKRKRLIDKFICKSAQIPYELGSDFEDVIIDDITYTDFWKYRITINFTQSLNINSKLFGQPQIDIFIYYDNTEMDDVFKLLSLISDEFSGQMLKIELDNGQSYSREIIQRGITTQTPIINNYERIGIRFSFYATIYKN